MPARALTLSQVDFPRVVQIGAAALILSLMLLALPARAAEIDDFTGSYSGWAEVESANGNVNPSPP